MKHSGPRKELLRYLDFFLPGVTCIPFEFPYIHCKPHRHVPTQRIWFLRFFVLKTDIHFAHFGLELGVVFEGKKRRVSTYLSFQFQIKEWERKRNICKFFDIISTWRPGLKKGVENDFFFCLKWGQELKNRAVHPPGVPPPPSPKRFSSSSK